MKVIVYVEGPTDVSALQTLLKPIIDAGRTRGVGINFHDLGGKGKWRLPVEEQNDDKPPKYVVDDLFRKYRKKPDKYIDATDAVWILARASLVEVIRGCPQRFAPFVKELRDFAAGIDPDAAPPQEPSAT